MFCFRLGNNPQLAELVYEADRGLQIQLNDFIQNYVFIMEEDTVGIVRSRTKATQFSLVFFMEEDGKLLLAC